MLGSSSVQVTLPVSDLEVAKQFYQQTLGLTAVGGHEESGVVLYKSGDTEVLVYASENAGTNKGTAATWKVSDPSAVVDELKAKGVAFEHYDNIPGVDFEGDVHVMGTMKAAWFKDPSGNVLCVSNES